MQDGPRKAAPFTFTQTIYNLGAGPIEKSTPDVSRYSGNDLFLLGTLDARMVGELLEKVARLVFAVFPMLVPIRPLHLAHHHCSNNDAKTKTKTKTKTPWQDRDDR